MIFDEIFIGIVNFDNLVVKYCFDDGRILAYCRLCGLNDEVDVIHLG